MAEEFDNEEKELDEKAVKKAEKERKKQDKAMKKKAMSESAAEVEDDEPGKGSKFLLFMVAVVLIALWVLLFALLIKWDVGGFGSSVLYPIFKDVPYVKEILPEVKEPEDDDPYAFKTMDEAVERIKELERQLEAISDASGEDKDLIASLSEEIARLKIFEQQQADSEKVREKFYKEVVFSDQAPDIEEYRYYYEQIEPENAAALYKQVVRKIQEDEELADYVKAYSSMKPKNAAAILEKMTDDLKLVAKILKNMNAEARGAILAAMDEKIAADLTELMEP
ncbi:MAG: hypothetical protein IJT81_05180 [Lachnospiraceae bacterium]|nr:hypothetical protein [Lachnospiraceae bacterium]